VDPLCLIQANTRGPSRVGLMRKTPGEAPTSIAACHLVIMLEEYSEMSFTAC
jgi:hypothetical protein